MLAIRCCVRMYSTLVQSVPYSFAFLILLVGCWSVLGACDPIRMLCPISGFQVKEIFTTLVADRTAVLHARQHQARDFRKTESKEESKKSKQAIKDRAANRLV